MVLDYNLTLCSVRSLLDLFSTLPDSTQVLTDVILENIEWAKKEKQIFLKQSLEIRLVALHLDNNAFKPALALVDNLLTELKRLDDKLILTEVHLLESRIYRGLGNMPKAKAALTSARTAANAIYCPPHLQAALDLQSGVLHAEDKDYKTAYSYFFETFENLSAQDDPKALNSLKYMLLCKIMLNLPEDVTSLLSIKLALKYAQLKEVESMRAVARAHQNRNLAEFEKALRDYRDELSSDPTIRSHLAALYDTLLEQNLLRIVEPYACVEVDHVAKVVGQDRQQIEQKLSQMILDKVFNGVLDQGRGCLIIFDAPEEDVSVFKLDVIVAVLIVPVTGCIRERDSDAGASGEGCRFVVHQGGQACVVVSDELNNELIRAASLDAMLNTLRLRDDVWLLQTPRRDRVPCLPSVHFNWPFRASSHSQC